MSFQKTALTIKQLRLLKTKFGEENEQKIIELFLSQQSLSANTRLPREKFFKISFNFNGDFLGLKVLIEKINNIRSFPKSWKSKESIGVSWL